MFRRFSRRKKIIIIFALAFFSYLVLFTQTGEFPASKLEIVHDYVQSIKNIRHVHFVQLQSHEQHDKQLVREHPNKRSENELIKSHNETNALALAHDSQKRSNNSRKELQNEPVILNDVISHSDTDESHTKHVNIPNVYVQEANCASLFNGDKEALERASSFKRRKVADRNYSASAGNCSKFIHQRGYAMQPVTEEEQGFPIAFSLLMFKDVEQAERLLRAIYRPQNVYCIHVDIKSRHHVYEAMVAITSCFPNVFLLQQRIDVRWGMWSTLEPELMCMRELWASSVKWKYFINLTGQEFPLQTNHRLVKILKAFHGANNLESTVKHKNAPRTKFIWKDGKNTGVRKPPPPGDITIAKGSLHIAVQRGFVDFLLHNETGQAFIEWTKETDIPDETLFSSLNISPRLNIPGAYTGTPETNLDSYPFLTRHKVWQSGIFNRPCGGKWVRTICIFGVRDLPDLAAQPHLFANKFHLEYQPLVLDCLEERHYNMTRQERAGRVEFDTEYYETRDFVKHHIDNYEL